jgi:CYTH domain-containing protein
VSAADEIERKFLIERAPEELSAYVRSEIDQGYLASDPADSTEVRLRRKGDKYWLTVKRGLGLKRLEREVALDEAQFETLWPLTEGARLQKTRYLIPSSDGTIELDVYRGSLDGLIVAEVEFASCAKADAYAPPAWFGRDVTDVAAYGNRALARLTREQAHRLIPRTDSHARQSRGQHVR